jgi:hypothetical protein
MHHKPLTMHELSKLLGTPVAYGKAGSSLAMRRSTCKNRLRERRVAVSSN